jgi:peptidoglycan/xylan/chitin deacetylase (PgdA/CDA1 family)
MNKNRPIIVLTFDDGTIIQYILIKLNRIFFKLPATIFIITGLLHDPHTGELLLSSYINKLRELFKLGIEIASHTHTHKDLTALKLNEIENELIKSKLYIAKILGVSPVGFAYPYGHYDYFAQKMVIKYYEYARIYDFKINIDTQFSQYAISSIGVEARKTIIRIIYWLLKNKHKMVYNKRKIMIVLVFHSPKSIIDIFFMVIISFIIYWLKNTSYIHVLTLKDAVKLFTNNNNK